MAPFDIEALTSRHPQGIFRKKSWSRVIDFNLTSLGWWLPLNSKWKDGMLGYWNIGYEKRMMF
jgi:hypothetical protein